MNNNNMMNPMMMMGNMMNMPKNYQEMMAQMQQKMTNSFNQIFNGNPMMNMQEMSKTDRYMAKTLEMGQDCNNIDDIKTKCKNLANQQGIDFGMIENFMDNMFRQMGILK